MIPVSDAWFLEEDAERVADCVRTGWVSSAGKSVDAFEAAWAAYCGRRHGVAMSSGMTALQAAVAALNLAPGDEVIMPSFTIVSCALAVVYSGGIPVLVDSDPRTWCMDVSQIESRVTPRTRAIMPVHIYGHPVEMDSLLDIASRHGLSVIEDAAEAHGAEYRSQGEWKRCGSFGDMSCFSFYANKLITTGEGGMVVLDDPELAARLRSLRDLCFTPGRRFEHTGLGYNFRLTNLQAALALPQIERIDELLRRKRCMARLYRQLLADIPGIGQPEEMPWARSIFWMYGIVLGDTWNFDAAELAARLRAEGVETRPFFLGMHEQPAFRERGLFQGERYPVAERLARRGLYLPSGLGSTEDQFRRVSESLHKVLA